MCPQSVKDRALFILTAHMETTHMHQQLLFFSFHFSLLLFLFVPPRFPKVNKLSDIYHHRTQAYNPLGNELQWKRTKETPLFFSQNKICSRFNGLKR